MLRVLNVVGARPNFMKIAPLVRAMEPHRDIHQTLVHTGQHYDDALSRVFFEELSIPKPDVDLGVGSASREEQIARIGAAFEPILLAHPTGLVLVVGDVNSTVACARVAQRHGVTVAHVEAGLRSFDLEMPEELNRMETDQISNFLFVTEPSGMENLKREDVRGKRFLVGNVMIDTLVTNLEKARKSKVWAQLGLTPNTYAAATFHRPSNVDGRENLLALLGAIENICSRVPLVLPLHPRTRASLEKEQLLCALSAIEDLTLTPPLGYLDFIGLVLHSKAVITDSGGVQEETTFLGVPCLTMRESTERPITVTTGSNILVGLDPSLLLAQLEVVLERGRRPPTVPHLWDGHAATRIVDILRQELIEG